MECPECGESVIPTKYGSCPCCRETITHEGQDTCANCCRGFNADRENLRIIGGKSLYFCDECLPIRFGAHFYRVRIYDLEREGVQVDDFITPDAGWLETAEDDNGVEVTITFPR